MNHDEHFQDESELKQQLDALAARITPDTNFTLALNHRLRQAHRAQANARPSWRLNLSPRLAFAFAFALAFSLLIGIPVLAQMGLLKYFVPVETTQMPWPQGTPMPFEPLKARDRAELERALGFAILAPTYLPDNCSHVEYMYFTSIRTAFLSYPCVDIMEQHQPADWRNNGFRQPVGPNAVQTLRINGQPAYYIEGTWEFRTLPDDTRTTPTWVPSGARRLVLERGDRLIDLAAMPDSITNGMISGLISKEELIRIAESMQ